MYQYSFNFKDKLVYNERFDDIFEWFDTIESRKLNSWCKREYDNSNEEVSDWYGCRTYQEAKSFLIQGVEKQANNYNNIVFNCTNGVKQLKYKLVKNIVGQQVSIPRFLQNYPKSMIQKVNMQKKTKKLDIVIIPEASCFVNSKELWSISYRLFDFFRMLYENNYIYNVSLLYTFMRIEEKSAYNCLIKVKENNEPLNNSIISSCAGLPSTFRKVSFRWYESCPNAKYISGYGQVISNIFDNEELKSFFDKFGFDNEHTFFISFQALRDRFGSLFKPKELLEYMEEQIKT